MGHLKTDKVGEGIELEFAEYSENERCAISPDIMEYDEEDYDPKFDLIIGTQTMQEMGIILDFSTTTIVIDKIKLPMRKIKDLHKPKILYQMFKNQQNAQILTQLYSNFQPESTKELTDHAIKIMDANYEKADLPKVVKDTYSHLKESKKTRAIESAPKV